MQRFFSTFPGSWPGLGLLLLRIVVGSVAAMQGVFYLANVMQPTLWTWLLGLLAVVAGAALIAGFLTPGSGVLAGLATVLIFATWAPGASDVLIGRVAAIFVVADGAALALLGPGAHSMDAYLFGRREIIIPRGSQGVRYDDND